MSEECEQSSVCFKRCIQNANSQSVRHIVREADWEHAVGLQYTLKFLLSVEHGNLLSHQLLDFSIVFAVAPRRCLVMRKCYISFYLNYKLAVFFMWLCKYKIWIELSSSPACTDLNQLAFLILIHFWSVNLSNCIKLKEKLDSSSVIYSHSRNSIQAINKLFEHLVKAVLFWWVHFFLHGVLVVAAQRQQCWW